MSAVDDVRTAIAVIGMPNKADVIALCDAYDGMVGERDAEREIAVDWEKKFEDLQAQIDRAFDCQFAIGSNEFNKWACGMMPAVVEKEVVIAALAQPASVVRTLFDLGREYERLVDANEQHRKQQHEQH